MKFTITRSTFLKTLNDVSRAISTKTTIPILTGLKIVLNDSGLILTGSDADISIESRINARMKIMISKSEALVKSSCQPVSLAKSLNVCQKAQ